MSKVTNNLVLIVNENKVTAWYLNASKRPKNIPIQGDSVYLLTSAAELTSVLQDVKDNIRDEIDRIHWLADTSARQQLTNPKQVAGLIGNSPDWQVLSLEWLAGRFGRKAARDVTEQELLSWLMTSGDAAERQHMKVAREREHATETERLQAQHLALEQENQQLQEQNAALRQVDKERLVSYLPALFNRVFTVIGATDLALLCGSVEPLNIPNPYPEPSTEALRVLQKQFCNLPEAAQLEIVQLVQELPHYQRLILRPEMRELVNELEKNSGTNRKAK